MKNSSSDTATARSWRRLWPLAAVAVFGLLVTAAAGGYTSAQIRTAAPAHAIDLRSAGATTEGTGPSIMRADASFQLIGPLALSLGGTNTTATTDCAAGQHLTRNSGSFACTADTGGSAAVNTTAPITGNGSVGSPIAMAAASGSVDGYIRGADFDSFNHRAGTGVCASGQYATSTVDNAGPTCAQVQASQLGGTLSQPQGGTGSGSLNCNSHQGLGSGAGTMNCKQFASTDLSDIPANGWVANAGGTPSTQEDTHANRPAAASVGRLFYETDTKSLFRDTGAAWDRVLGPVADSDLASSYSGVGACSAGQYISAVVHNAAPTCGQVAYSQLSGTPTIPADVSGKKYLIQTADGALPNAQAMGALATGLVKNTTTTGVQSIATSGTDYAPGTGGNATGLVLSTTTTGALSAYGGSSCAYAVKSLDASGAATCTSAPTIPTDLSAEPFITKTASSNLSNEFALGSLATGLLKNTTTTGVPTIAVAGTDYIGPTSGSSMQLADGAGGLAAYGGSGTCSTSNWFTALSATGAKTCTRPAPSDLSGAAADSVILGDASPTWTVAAVPSCSTASSALSYNTSTHAFGCNSISASGTVTTISGPTGVSWTNPTTTPSGSWSGAYAGVGLFEPDPANGLSLVYRGYIGGAQTTFTLIGSGPSYGSSGTGTGAAVANGNTTSHPYIKITSGSTASGNYEGFTSSAVTAGFSTDYKPRFTYQHRSDATITTMTVWIAVLTSTPLDSNGVQPSVNTPGATFSGTMYGLAFDPSVDSHVLVCSSNASKMWCTASSVTYSANTDYGGACDLARTTAATVTCTINGTVATNTNTQPGATLNLTPECSVVTRTTASRSAFCGNLSIYESD